jgi:hypothetical protein
MVRNGGCRKTSSFLRILDEGDDNEDLIIGKEKITALLEGKTLAHEDGEYSHTFTLEKIQMTGNVEDRFTKEQIDTFFNVFETIVRNQTVGSCMINGKKFIVAYGVVE